MMISLTSYVAINPRNPYDKIGLDQHLAGELKISLYEASLVITTVLETMTEALCRGEAVEIRGFGSFVVKHYDGYVGRNPKAGKEIEVKSKKLPFFKVGKELREKVNEGHQDQQLQSILCEKPPL